MKRFSLIVVIMFLAAAAGCSDRRTFQRSEVIMGTTVTITVVARDRSEGEAAIARYVERQVEAADPEAECARCSSENECGEFILFKCSRELMF